MFRRITIRAGIAVVAVATVALLSTSSAFAVDADGNGYHDALIREAPYLPYANVGAKCDIYYSYGWRARLTVRPPRIWAIWGQYNQNVAWRARFYDISTGRDAVTDSWRYFQASPNAYTDGGGGRNAPAIAINSTEYWAGSRYTDHPIDTTASVKAVIDVAWQDARNGVWVTRTLPIAYYYQPYNNVVQPSATMAGC